MAIIRYHYVNPNGKLDFKKQGFTDILNDNGLFNHFQGKRKYKDGTKSL